MSVWSFLPPAAREGVLATTARAPVPTLPLEPPEDREAAPRPRCRCGAQHALIEHQGRRYCPDCWCSAHDHPAQRVRFVQAHPALWCTFAADSLAHEPLDRVPDALLRALHQAADSAYFVDAFCDTYADDEYRQWLVATTQ